MWNALTGVLVTGPFQGHNGVVYSVSFSPDAERIVSGSLDSTVRIWDAHSGALIATLLEGHTRIVWSVAFSLDGNWIASGSQDRTVRLWDARNTISVPHIFEGHSGPVWSVAFSPDSQRVVSSSVDRTIRVSEVRTAHIDINGCADVYIQIKADSTPHRPFGDSWTLKDGWILSPASQLILWVPPWLREGLYFPETSLVISVSGTTQLDFSDFAHGTSWQECMQSLHLARSN
jgi:WD40 repeat protein